MKYWYKNEVSLCLNIHILDTISVVNIVFVVKKMQY